MVAPSKISALSLPRLGQAEELGHGPGRRVALQPGHGSGREDQHAVRRLAAQRLLPGEGHHIELRPVERLGEAGAGGVADGEARAIGGDEIGVRHAHAGGRAVPGEDEVGLAADPGEVRQSAVGRVQHLRLEFQLLDHVGHPVLAEGLEGQKLHRPRAEQRPQGHLHRPGVGARDDADAGSRPGPRAPRGSGRWPPAGAPCPAFERCERPRTAVREVFGAPSGALGAGAGRKFGPRRPHGRLGEGRHSDVSHPCRWAAPRWEGVARRAKPAFAARGKRFFATQHRARA